MVGLEESEESNKRQDRKKNYRRASRDGKMNLFELSVELRVIRVNPGNGNVVSAIN